MEKPILSIIVPCYNEEDVLYETNKRLLAVIDTLVSDNMVHRDSFIMYVNDGSHDKTWKIITELHSLYNNVKGVCLAANSGHQNALIAGMNSVVSISDMVITIDADLQDDVNAISEMVKCYNEGNDIVYGVRSSRTTDSYFKRITAIGFYKFMGLLGVKSIFNHADYRLMSNRAVKHLLSFRERNLFLRGLVPLVGYKSTKVYYVRASRFAGESKYPFIKMMNFALDGITSFSIKPVRFIFFIGLFFIIIAFLVFLWVLYNLIGNHTVHGWASLILSIWFCSGVLLIAIGIIGEYIGKIYIEVKDRPRYNIAEILK